ncbi:MAG: hypothetical protein ABJJ69_11905 [Paracoccaceae bacterium]
MTKIDGIFQPKKGFALIAVLLALATLTVLFAVTSSHVVSSRAGLRTDQILLARSANAADLLRLAAHWKRDIDPDSLEFHAAQAGVRIRFQDVGGLVDLNTGRPELIDKIAETIGIDRDGLADFREWRRNANRLQRVEDFYRISGFSDASGQEDLRRWATVHSGRPGIALDHVPSDLKTQLSVLDIEEFDSPATGATFLVENVNDENRRIILGVIHIPASGPIRILRVN